MARVEITFWNMQGHLESRVVYQPHINVSTLTQRLIQQGFTTYETFVERTIAPGAIIQVLELAETK